ncbi:hypothetical protein [Solicola sp. PLA-1-18]|uniref:hypothetical protein n=1 Tax=Solicola sp. PLA-1-18 TaxID=3380532 RepID=UPI003B7AF671
MIGPSGVRARPHPWWTPVRLLLAAAVVASLVTVLRSVPCATGDDAAWWDPPRDQTLLCANDLPRDYVDLGLAEGVLPLADEGGRHQPSDLSAPVATLAWGTAAVARTLRGGDTAGRDDVPLETLSERPDVRGEALAYTALATLLQLLAFWLVVALVARVVRREEAAERSVLGGGRGPLVPSRLWWLAAPPVLVVGGLAGWSMVPVALAVAGFVAWRSRRPVLAGVLCGVALASAGLALAVLVALVAVVLRVAGAVATRVLASTFVTWIVLTTAAFVLTGGESSAALTQALTAGRGPRTTWGLLAAVGVSPEPGRVGLLSAVGWLLVLVLVVGLGQVRRWSIDPAALVVVSLAGLVTVSTVDLPAQGLWLLPFVVLAHRGPTAVRDIGLWQLAEVLAHLTGAWQAAGATVAIDGSDPLAVVGLLLRLAATWWIAWRVVRASTRDDRPARLPADQPVVS